MRALVLAAVLFALPARAADDGSVSRHLPVGMLLGASFYTGASVFTEKPAPRMLIATGSVAVAAVAWEMTDRRFSGSDVALGVAGAVTGALITAVLESAFR